MLKRISKMGIVFLVICIIMLLIWYVYEYVTEKQQVNPSDNIPNNDNIEIISKLNTEFIDENHILENVIQIDDDNYLLVSRVKIVYNDNDRDSIESSLYDCTIYKYNIHNGVHLKNVQFNRHFEYMGISNESKTLWITLEDLEKNDRTESEIWEIDYENMIVKNEYMNTKGAYNLKISQDNSKWIYTTEEGMYVSDVEFKNEKLLLKNIPDKIDILNSKGYVPYEVFDDKAIYAKLGYEWVEGLGIIDINDDSNIYEDLMDVSYLAYKDNNIYFTQCYEPKTIVKINMNTLEQEEVFKLDEQTINYGNTDVYLSKNLKYILVNKTRYLDDSTEIMLKIYDFNTKDLISDYNISQKSSIQIVGFSNNKVMFINSDKLYSWNFSESKGEQI